MGPMIKPMIKMNNKNITNSKKQLTNMGKTTTRISKTYYNKTKYNRINQVIQPNQSFHLASQMILIHRNIQPNNY